MASRAGSLCFHTFGRRYSSAPLPAYNFKPRNYEGPAYEKTSTLKAAHIPPAVYNVYKNPLLIHQGHMQWLFDHKGRRYLDLFGGIVTVSVGHCHPKVVAALTEQASKLWHTTNIYRHPKIYDYVEKLSSKFGGNLKVVYLVNSGTEANELATLLAKSYTGNNDIISLQGSYHGYSNYVQGLTATQCYRMPIPGPSGIHHAMLPDPLRGVWGGCRDSLSQVPGSCSCPDDCVTADKYVHQLSELIENSIPKGKVAGFFAESIQGVNGTVQFPKGYLRKAAEVIRKSGGVYIADEVQTGFGRTGDAFWGFENHGVVPDIVTMAKGIGNGFPMAAVVTTKEIADAHMRATYFNTFGGNPLASTVGEAVLNVIEEENLQENCKKIGQYMIENLMDLQKTYPVIGDVRGKGLMLGIELVEPGTKEPLNVANVSEIQENMKDLGILIGRGGRYNNVQTGFGRTGDAFWGFENHGVVPDIVTMAKGIGNGFPMAAVVTTKEIADAHMRATYFNTFGGNPLASTVGEAVLNVIEEENLQENCKKIGQYMIENLMDLQKTYPVIGDVRGKGLMLGIELVEPGTKEPLNVANVSEIQENMKDLGILIGRGGRYNNVLRIKPPMCITRDNVDFTISVLDKSLKQYSNK